MPLRHIPETAIHTLPTQLAEAGQRLEDLYFAVTEGAAPEGSV